MRNGAWCMLLGAGDLLSPDLVMWMCSACEKPNKVHHYAFCSHMDVYYVSLKLTRWHARKNVHKPLWSSISNQHHSQDDDSSIKHGRANSPYRDTLFSGANCRMTEVLIAYLRSLRTENCAYALLYPYLSTGQVLAGLNFCRFCTFLHFWFLFKKMLMMWQTKKYQIILPWHTSKTMEFTLRKEHPKGQSWRKDFSWDTTFDFRVIFSSKLFKLHNCSHHHNYISNNGLQWR